MPARTPSFCALLLIGVAAAAAQDQSAGGGSPFQRPAAEQLIRIEYDPSLLPLAHDTIEALINSAAIRGPVLQAHLDASDEARAEVELRFDPVGPGRPSTLLGRLMVYRLPAPAATAVVSDLCERLRAALQHASEIDREQLEQRFVRARHEAADAEHELTQLQDQLVELRRAAGRTDMNPDVIGNELSDLREQRRRLDMEMTALKAREAALANQVAQIGAQVERGIGTDPVIHELERVLELKEQQLAQARQLVESKNAPDAHLLEVLEGVARTRAAVAERRHAAQMQAGGERLSQLNAELASLAVQTAELEARAAWLSQTLQELDDGNLLARAAEFERGLMQQRTARDRLESAIHQWRELESALQDFREPQVTIIGAAERP